MKRITILMMLGAAALFAACSTDGVDGQLYKNQPPTVWLSAGPPEGSTGKYRVQMFWGGWDPDGEIDHYEYIVTDNTTGVFNPADTVGVPWQPVHGNDSTFTFSADEESDTLNTVNQVAEFTRSHTFFIRAVDTGTPPLRSTEPAFRSFTSRTLSPEIESILVPVRNFLNPAEVPAITTFRWKAKDWIDDRTISQEPDSVQWALVSTAKFGGNFTKTINYIRSGSPSSLKEWYPWVWYPAPGDSGKFWTTPPLDLGTYVFALRAKDEAGAVTPVLTEEDNIRRIKVAQRSGGPTLTVSNPYIGIIRTAICNHPIAILDSPAGVSLEFTVTASALSYGGQVSGWRYGWDITDLNDPEKWEIDFTPILTANVKTPPRSFFFGTHVLTIEVIDNSGYCSRITIKVNIVQFTLERDLLLVDDFVEGTNNGWQDPIGHGVYPSDDEHDAFWLDMLSDVNGFDPGRDVVDTHDGVDIPLATLAQYKSIIFSSYSDWARKREFPKLYAYIQFRSKDPTLATTQQGKVLPNVLALAMAAGSHIMIVGNQPVENVVNRQYASGVRYPLIFYWELEGKQKDEPDIETTPPVGDLSFAYKELCLETLDFSTTLTTRRRPGTGSKALYCGVDRVRVSEDAPNESMRTAWPIDPGFPPLALRPEAAGPGQWYAPGSPGTLDVEVYNPAYFQRGSTPVGCDFVPQPRSCFEPVWGLGCLGSTKVCYHQPIAFWTSAYADRVADVPGAVAARSIVIGFPPVYFNPSEVKPGIEHVLFDEWKLPQISSAVVGSR